MRRQLFITAISILCVSLAQAADPIATPATSSTPTMGGTLLQMGVVLLLVIGLLLGLAWLLRRAGIAQGTANGQLRVIGAVSVGQRERVVLVQVGQEQLVLGVTAAEVNLLHLLPEPIDVMATTENASVGIGFAQRLQQAIQNRRSA